MPEPADLAEVATAICDEKGYTFLGDAGGGAFKQTFRVSDANGNDIALKVYMPENRNEREDREISAMQRCDHPNIAKFYSLDIFSYKSRHYLYTLEEYIGGGTLQKKLSRGSLTPAAVKQLGADLIDAVAHIASRKLVHRDLKPENILFRLGNETPVIVDFGIVRDLNATSMTKTWLSVGPGTPYYASPEQLNNNKQLQDWRCDQFSLGVLLSICAFGIHPYSSEWTDYDTVNAVAQRQGPSSEFKANVRSSGLLVLEQMVDPWPANRLRTAAKLKREWLQQNVEE